MVQAMVHELDLQRSYLTGEEIQTIYFGGGTPSLLTREELISLINSIHKNFAVSTDAEITLEANPDDLTSEKLSILKALGINRLSIGIQSFNNDLLAYLNRAHTAETAKKCVHEARALGFSNISIDLIYALPDESEELWRKDIEQALSLAPEHISSYSLTIEPKTTFGKWAKQGKLKITDDDIAAQQLEILMETLEVAGYEHYEVSNFAKPGFYSKHNSSYWKNQPYLGIGPSAHSFNKESRHYTVSNNHLYLKSMASHVVPVEKEVLTDEDKINEYILTTLRTSWGCNCAVLRDVYGYDLQLDRHDYLMPLLDKGYATLTDSILILTKKGKLVADKIASDLFVLV